MSEPQRVLLYTPGPWKFEPMKDFDALHKLKGTTPEPHEGYFRSNGGDWGVAKEGEGRICMVDFKGTAKRGQGYNAPDTEGQANARLIAAAPDLLEALEWCVRHLKMIEEEKHPDTPEHLRKFTSRANAELAISKAINQV